MSLPDEILSEILSPALKVPDDVFCDTTPGQSPFANYTESSSACLVVCKSWLRVATPLLYNVVILRSKAQAKALAGALAQNAELGRFIKKLRVEGGFGPSMHTVLRCAPNISDLYLTFEVYSPDNTDGLCDGLKLINPTRLILTERQYKVLKNKMVMNLVQALVEGIKKWDRLRIFHCRDWHCPGRVNALVVAFKSASCLQHVVVPNVAAARSAKTFLEGYPLSEIVVTARPLPLKEMNTFYADVFGPDAKPPVRFRYTIQQWESNSEETASVPFVPLSLNPFFTPMASAPQDVQDTVWSRVLYFAMHVSEREREGTSIYKKPPAAVGLLCVSRKFLTLGLAHYYAHVVLRSRRDTVTLRSVLSTHACVSAQIQTIRGDPNYQEWEEFLTGSSPDDVTREILSRTPMLRRLDLLRRLPYLESYWRQISITWAAFDALAQNAGSSLTEFSAGIQRIENIVPTPFKELTALETLHWKSWTSFVGLADMHSLPRLRQLRVSEAHHSFFVLLENMKVPALTHLVLYPASSVPEKGFWDAHGDRLTVLEISQNLIEGLHQSVLDICPNLKLLVVAWARDEDEEPLLRKDLVSRRPATSLANIHLRVFFDFETASKALLASWEKFLTDLPLESLPSLKDIEFLGFEWPKTQREISKSGWVRAAEKLLTHQVTTTDENGVTWRSRLKAGGKGRK
ncbi:hypothetical protein C8F01DRAFT_1033534 [Mycena amicta]|nr:hypothetical protein C8F01DRAFT_1033534 [Mycena amicta]